MILYQLQAWSELKENRTLQHDKLVKSRSILLKDRGQRSVIVCPLGAVWAYYIKVPYLLVRHHKRLYTRLNKVTLCFSFGGSRQSLKVCEVKCIPGDPAITCPVLFKGSCSPLSLA